VRSRAERLEGPAFEQAESPRWDGRDGRLIWVDMSLGELHIGRLDDGGVRSELVVDMGDTIGFAAPLPGLGEGWVCTRGRDILHVSEDGSAAVVVEGIGASGTQFNDGACDPTGMLWAGTQSHARVPDAALVTFDGDGRVRERLGGVTVSNGLGFTGDGSRMYYIDTLPHRRLEVFDVVDGELTGRRALATIDGGNPDGLVVDQADGVWVAVWDAGEVRRFDEDGRLTHTVEVGARRPSAVCLVGSTLVVTSARRGLADPTDNDGRFFGVEVGIPGLPAAPWRPTSALRATLGL
jgi:sugar lactone lactonase YvrE